MRYRLSVFTNTNGCYLIAEDGRSFRGVSQTYSEKKFIVQVDLIVFELVKDEILLMEFDE